MAVAEQEQVKAARGNTPYLVLVQNEDGAFAPITTVEALNDQKAIQKVVSERSYDLGGTFVAVPARSFKVRTVAVESTPRVRIS